MNISQPPSLVSTRTPAGKASIRTHFLGPHPLIEHYLRRLNVEGILQEHLPHRKQGILTHARAICILIHNILTSPGALYRLENWVRPIEAQAIGLTEEEKLAINDDRLGRALDALGSERARGIWFRLALRGIKEWKLHILRVHFDTTRFKFKGEYKNSGEKLKITQGYNPERSDLKQVVFGLNVTSDGAVPLLHRVWSGNRTDDTVHRSNFDRLRHLLGTTDFIYVADSKLASTENMAHLAAFKGKFVTLLPRTRKEDQEYRTHLKVEKGRWTKIYEVKNKRHKNGPPNVFSTPVGGESKTEEGYRLIWYRSSQKAMLDQETRMNNLQNAEVKLDTLALKLDHPRKTPPPRKKVRKSIDKILKAHSCQDFITIELKRNEIMIPRRFRRGRPRQDDPIRMEVQHSWTLRFERDKEAMEAENRTDGVFPLVAHGLDRLSRKKVLEIYKYQAYIEKRFSLVKTDLGISPVFLKKITRVAALIDVYFIAMAVASLLERDLRAAMAGVKVKELPLFPEGRTTKTPTAPRILEAFSSIMWKEFTRRNELICFPLELNDIQKQLLSLFGLAKTIYK